MLKKSFYYCPFSRSIELKVEILFFSIYLEANVIANALANYACNQEEVFVNAELLGCMCWGGLLPVV